VILKRIIGKVLNTLGSGVIYTTLITDVNLAKDPLGILY